MMIGPVCPGPQRIKPNPKCADKPYDGKLAVISATTEEVVATVVPNNSGEFSVAVPAGRYYVKWATPRSDGRSFQSSPIQVNPNQITSVQLRFDTGMR
jgi:hypothetical protein